MLRALRESAARGRTGSLAVLFALAFAVLYVALALAQVAVSAVAQHHELTFHIGNTEINYDALVTYAITLALIVIALWGLWRTESRVLRTCPSCKSDVPADASVCRYCSSELTDA